MKYPAIIFKKIHWPLIKRWFKHKYQKLVRGWDDSDTWSLDYTIAKFALPRLKRFKELKICHPADMTTEKWNSKIDDMIYWMEFIIEDSNCVANLDEWDENRLKRGHKNFGKHFRDLWR